MGNLPAYGHVLWLNGKLNARFLLLRMLVTYRKDHQNAPMQELLCELDNISGLFLVKQSLFHRADLTKSLKSCIACGS